MAEQTAPLPEKLDGESPADCERFRQYLLRGQGLSQAALGELLGLTQSVFSGL